MLVGQWYGFYTAIYVIPWLGWDLMEPITYTVEKTVWMGSVAYYLKNRKDDSYNKLLDRYETTTLQKASKKTGLSLGRIKVLLEEKDILEGQIDDLESLLN